MDNTLVKVLGLLIVLLAAASYYGAAKANQSHKFFRQTLPGAFLAVAGLFVLLVAIAGALMTDTFHHDRMLHHSYGWLMFGHVTMGAAGVAWIVASVCLFKGRKQTGAVIAVVAFFVAGLLLILMETMDTRT